MKKLMTGLLLMSLLVWIQQTQAQSKKKDKPGTYGVAITKDGAVEVTELPSKMNGQNALAIKIKGTVAAACQVKGCWMTADLGNGKSMRIRFKDYGFFVPKDCAGKTFYAQGVASWDTTSVQELRHYAQDAGKTEEEIAQINTPETELTFLAEGVLIERKKQE